MDLREIARALGGVVSGRQVLAPGPNHSHTDRSLSVRLSPQSPGGFLCHSFAGDSWEDCRDHVSRKLGIPLDVWRGRARQEPAPVRPTRTDDGVSRRERALEIWNGARLPHGTVAERYLVSRGLALPSDLAATALRFHPACPWRDEARGETIFVPTMLAAMRTVEGDSFAAVHRTRLSADGQKVDRRMLAPSAGAAIKLDPDSAVSTGLTVGEGIETCLAARQMGFGPVWACGSTGNIAKLPVLGGVECLTILGEVGEASARAVAECSERWLAAGREVVVVQPLVGTDMNDALRAAA